MLLPGQTLLVVEMTPALFAAVAANVAERVGPGPDARHRLDDRRRRPRLSGRRHAGYRPRARGDRARTRRRSRDASSERASTHWPRRRSPGSGFARRRRPRCATSPRTTPTASTTATARTPCASTAPATARRSEIESELQWVDALREDGAVDTPTASPRHGGERVVDLGTHNVVLFEWLPGVDPGPRRRRPDRRLQDARRRLRAHARARARVDAARAASTARTGTTRTRSAADGHWGAWQDGLGMGPRGARAARPARRHDRRGACARYGQRRALRPRARRHPPRQPAGGRRPRCA